jgi:hypothetical protein
MQPRWLSFVEAVTNIVVGYGLAVLTQIIVFPLFGLHASLGENFLLAALFTCISLIRSFAIRRLFNGAWLARSGEFPKELTIR